MHQMAGLILPLVIDHIPSRAAVTPGVPTALRHQLDNWISFGTPSGNTCRLSRSEGQVRGRTQKPISTATSRIRPRPSQ